MWHLTPLRAVAKNHVNNKTNVVGDLQRDAAPEASLAIEDTEEEEVDICMVDQGLCYIPYVL